MDMPTLDIELLAEDFALDGTDIAGLAMGANRALIGGEIVQFAAAIPLGGKAWRLTGLLRGRGGTERAALTGHAAGAPFVLLDGKPLPLDPAKTGNGARIAALGLADASPAYAEIANPGLTLRPLSPVHPRAERGGDGSLRLRWIRRARGAWAWLDEVEIPLGEQAESYRVGLGPVDAPLAAWEVSSPGLTIAPATLAALEAAHGGTPVWVRQIGSFAQSDPLLLTTLS